MRSSSRSARRRSDFDSAIEGSLARLLRISRSTSDVVTVSPRAAAEDTISSKLLDAVHRELAEQSITDPTRSLSEISFLLGFSELSAFSRAFRRWTGQSPSAARDAAA